jgi:hypothetical protein
MPYNQKLTTGRLYWQKSGEDSWLNFGNALSYARKPRIEYLKHFRKANGLSHCDLDLPRETEVLWSFSFDERFGELIRPMWLANVGATVTNAGGASQLCTIPGLTAALSPAILVGRAYPLKNSGAAVLGITTLIGSVIAADTTPATLIEGTHYELDRNAGIVRPLIVPTPGLDWNFTVSWAAYSQEAVTALGNLLTQGTFKVVEKDQQSDVPFNEETITGQVYVTAWGENDGSKFSEYQVEVLHNPGNP